MPLTVSRRKDRGGVLTITGTVAGQSVRRRAQSDHQKLAEEEARVLEASLLRSAWHGERRGNRSFAEAAKSYLAAAPRGERDKAYLRRILIAVGTASLREVTQEKMDQLRATLYPQAAPATVVRGLIVPIRTVMRHAHRRGWCDAPSFEVPRETQGRTIYIVPSEAERLILAAAPNFKPLITFLLGTGARLSEALGLEWRDVDLQGQRAIFQADNTKSGKRRVVWLPPRVGLWLARMPKVADRVFTNRYGIPYQTSRERGDQGYQIGSGWEGALRRAGLSREITPHVMRHTFATWHYAIHKDLLRLKIDGGWASLRLVERYAHLAPSGLDVAIRDFWGQETEEMTAHG